MTTRIECLLRDADDQLRKYIYEELEKMRQELSQMRKMYPKPPSQNKATQTDIGDLIITCRKMRASSRQNTTLLCDPNNNEAGEKFEDALSDF